jgi:hypothetical protein
MGHHSLNTSPEKIFPAIFLSFIQKEIDKAYSHT